MGLIPSVRTLIRKELGTALFILATPLLLTYPLIARLGEGFFATPFVGGLTHSGVIPGDHLNNAYRFWLFADAISQGTFRLGDPYAFGLLGQARDPAFGWLFGPIYALWAWLFGPVVSYNLLVLLSLVLTGTFTYLWLRRIGLTTFQATMGAVAFMVFPIGLDRLTGHIKAFFFWLMPVALWAVERARARGTGRGAFAWGALAGLAVASLVTVIEPETGVYFWPILLAYSFGRMRREVWPGVLLGLMLSVVYILWFYARVVAPSIMTSGRPFEAVLAFSPTIGDLFRRTYPPLGSERYIYPGIAAIVALYGGWKLLRADAPIGRKLAMLAAPLIIAGSLGPKAPLVGALYQAAYNRIPPIRVVQTPSRLMFVLGPLLALGFAFALKRLSNLRTRWAVAVVITGILILDARAVFYSLSRPLDPNVFRGVEGVRGILDLPVTDAQNFLASTYNYATTLLPARRVGGVSPVAPLETIEGLEVLGGIGVGELDDFYIDFACDRGVSHVMLWEDLYGLPYNVPPDPAPVLSALRSHPRFHQVASRQGIHVFRLSC